MQLRGRGVDTNAQYLGDFLMAFILEHIEVEYGPVACRQLFHHLLDHLWRYVLDRRIFLLNDVVGVLFQKCQFMMAVFPDKVQRLIHSDPHRPGLEGASPSIPEVCDVGDDANQYLLQHIPDIFLINDVSCADGFQMGNVQGTEHPHRRVVTTSNLLCQSLLVVAAPYMIHLDYPIPVYCPIKSMAPVV